MTRTLSPAGLAHLVHAEGRRLMAYRDVAGYWTIGVGHLLTDEELRTGVILIDGLPVAWRERGLTDAQVDRLCDQDADWAERTVSQLVTVPLTQSQFDALVSFVFNVGPVAFAKSTLLRRLNAGEYGAVPGQLRRWVFAGGKRWEGLVTRREAEVRVWQREG